MQNQTNSEHPPHRGKETAAAKDRTQKRAEALKRNLLRRKQADTKPSKQG